MDSEFIEIEHRENVFKLMEICGLDMNQAYQLYVNSGNNFEVAVHTHLNPSSIQSNSAPIIPPQPVFNQHLNDFRFEEDFGQDDRDYDINYIKYKNFKAQGGIPFEKKYPVRKHQGFFKSLIPKFFKGDEQNIFKAQLEKYIDRRIDFKAEIGNLSEAIHNIYADRFPLAIIMLSFKPEMKNSIKDVFSDQGFVQKMLNVQFKNYGLNALTYNIEPELKPLFNPQNNIDSLIICRIDYLDEIQIVAKIKLDLSVSEIKQKLKLAKSQSIQRQMEEMHILKQYDEQRRGNYNYVRPKTVKENKKIKEDRKLRKEQQQEFYKACLPKKEQVSSSKQPEKKIEEEIKKEEVVNPLAILKKRQQLRSKLQKYQEGINFKIRVPSGHNLLVKIGSNETVQYLFDYIESQTEDLGFNDQNKRIFDIFIGFGGTDTLKDKKSSKLSELFEGSEALIVREIVD